MRRRGREEKRERKGARMREGKKKRKKEIEHGAARRSTPPSGEGVARTAEKQRNESFMLTQTPRRELAELFCQLVELRHVAFRYYSISHRDRIL